MNSAVDAKRLVAAAYDESADRFAGVADRFVYRLLAQPLIAALGPVDGPVLDVAAGAGAAGRHFPRVVALDLSMGQLRYNLAARRVCADAEQLPFRRGFFAAAVSVFGINHFPEPAAAVREMARVASVVGLSTWSRPEPPYPPKQVVLDVLARHGGRSRSSVGELVDDMGERVGSPEAVTALLDDAGLEPRVELVTVAVPWPGVGPYLDYRLSMATTTGLGVDIDAVRRDAAAALAALPVSELDWRVGLVVGVGRRRRGGS